ncbi:hypothetical protein GB864_10115, partial [Agromyces sp. MMS17-SY077]|nr:hypothetical protein [Agromyces seonyuensis]
REALQRAAPPPVARPAAAPPAAAPPIAQPPFIAQPTAQRPPSSDAALSRPGAEPFRPVVPEALDGYRPGGPTLQADPAVLEFDAGSTDTARLQQLATGQLLIVGRPAPETVADGALDESEQRRVYSAVGVVLGVVGVLASLFVGWMVPISVAAIVFGVLGLRREEGRRTASLFGVYAGVVGVVFSAIWLGYYLITFGVLPA